MTTGTETSPNRDAVRRILDREDVHATIARAVRCFKRKGMNGDYVITLISIHAADMALMGAALCGGGSFYAAEERHIGQEQVALAMIEVFKLDLLLDHALVDYFSAGGTPDDEVRISFQFLATGKSIVGSAKTEQIALSAYGLTTA